MEEIKKLFKISLAMSVFILLVGVVIGRQELYIGMFGGSILSNISLYMICLDVKTSVYSGSPMKSGVVSYLKRYAIYGIYLGVMGKYFGFSMLICSAIGLLSVKFSIYIMTVFNYIHELKRKSETKIIKRGGKDENRTN